MNTDEAISNMASLASDETDSAIDSRRLALSECSDPYLEEELSRDGGGGLNR